MNEKEALRRLARGDEVALGWFIDRYAAYVGAVLHSVTGGAMTAQDREEAASDVFVAFWQSGDRVQPGKAKAYLAAIARNKAKMFLRKSNIELPLEGDVLSVAGEDMEQGLEEREQREILYRAVLSMGQPDREIFLRYYYYCQPVGDIAARLQMKPATVKTRLHRGRARLKEILTQGGYTVED
ncbi:MAG: sigma-70 family RNA polymerase sigma factor [Oscillospiraceae bacterium]|nr:sigma-70 family RNA polymerase sigma factor [Oscillospiraceae bacterium]